MFQLSSAMSETRKPAHKGDHARWDVTLRHVTCGTVVSRSYTGHYECVSPGCRVKWKAEIIGAFTDAEMAERFYTTEPADCNDYVFVERQDEFSKKAFTVLIKRSELRPTDTRLKV